MRILLVVLVACVALPAGAEAATVSRTGGALHYEAAKGERIVATLGETSGGAFVVRRANSPHQRLTPGTGCKRLPPRAVRCAGQGVVRVEISFKRARTSSVTVGDVRAAVAVRGAAAVSSILVRATPEFTYAGGPGRDSVNVENLDGHSTSRLGAGLDFFSGPLDTFHGSRNSAATFAVDGGPGRDRLVGGPAADSLDGGTGADTLEGAGGADTLTGGAGSDTAVFGTLTPDPEHDAGPISVTLDGQRNDGNAGQDALVGSDVENATILFTSPPGDDVLVGNDGPNVLVGPGAVQGLGGNDTLVTDNYYPDAGKLLDGGDGDDRIGALASDPDGGFDASAASIVCGPGADVVFTNAPAPADCERSNVGMHVLGARSIGRKGVVRARVDCTDPRGCVLSLLRLKFHGRVADERVAQTPAIRIPFGESRIASAPIKPRIWKRERRHRSFHVEITPAPQPTRIYSPAVSTGSYPRALTLRITR